MSLGPACVWSAPRLQMDEQHLEQLPLLEPG